MAGVLFGARYIAGVLFVFCLGSCGVVFRLDLEELAIEVPSGTSLV